MNSYLPLIELLVKFGGSIGFVLFVMGIFKRVGDQKRDAEAKAAEAQLNTSIGQKEVLENAANKAESDYIAIRDAFLGKSTKPGGDGK